MTEQIAQRLVDIAFKVSFEGDFTDLRKHLELQGYKIRIDHEGTKFATMSADGRIATAFMAYSDPITVLSGMPCGDHLPSGRMKVKLLLNY